MMARSVVARKKAKCRVLENETGTEPSGAAKWREQAPSMAPKQSWFVSPRVCVLVCVCVTKPTLLSTLLCVRVCVQCVCVCGVLTFAHMSSPSSSSSSPLSIKINFTFASAAKYAIVIGLHLGLAQFINVAQMVYNSNWIAQAVHMYI